MQHRPKPRREPAELPRPVGRHRHWRHDEHAPPPLPRIRPPFQVVQHERYRLHRLAEAHVVRKARPEPPSGEERKPGVSPELVVAQCPLQPPGRRQQREALFAAKLVQESAQPAVRSHLRDPEPADPPSAEREGHGLARAQALRHLQRAQGLAQHVAVHLDPSVPEEHERRALVQQELDLLLRHLLAVNAYREPGGDLPGDGAAALLRLARREVRLGRDMLARDADGHLDRESCGREGLRARPEEVLGLCCRQFGRAAAQALQRREHSGGLAERNEPATGGGRGGEAQQPRAVGAARRLKCEMERGAVRRRHGERRLPRRKVAHEGARLRLPAPRKPPGFASQRRDPRVMHRLVPPVVVLERRTPRAPHKRVNASGHERRLARRKALQHRDGTPPGGEAAALLHESWQIASGAHYAGGDAEERRRRQHFLAEEHARLEAAPPHVREEHHEIRHRRAQERVVALRLVLLKAVLVPHHLSRCVEKRVAAERRRRRAGGLRGVGPERRAPDLVDFEVQLEHR